MAVLLEKFKPDYARRETTTVTIASGASVSGTINLTNTSLIGFITPAAWTTAALNLEVSADGSTWVSAYDAYGSQVGSIATPVVSAGYAVDVSSLMPWQYARFRSGTSAAPVVQVGNRVFTVVTRVLA